ncbi:uridylate kinase [Histoplasma capsulatum]|uniref:Uridylate kinase n=1 Tax=Ajellomyces capsulatus TaxID=5037 RepID=A0A8A1M506_AJECA|nr:uridylate kinase [Histoplasma mississippiense (nom. inval.)]EDN09243.1 uridylate kinase [Histoplasma mississippiense (nom. inval.)]QSS59833.1 uridylate kinase [Histoplasma capsulatum]
MSSPQKTPTTETADSTTHIPAELTPPLSSTNTTPKFSPDAIIVVFVLGGPGSGKGTQSANLVRDYGFTHLSAGDLLRAEQQRAGSQYGDLIRHHIREGIIVPMEITVALLSNAMAETLERKRALRRQQQQQQQQQQQKQQEEEEEEETPSSSVANDSRPARFLIDGFPRKMDQATFFEETVCPSAATIFLRCPEDVMLERLLKRGKTSGRDDDNIESIRKRFRVFEETSMPVIHHYEKEGKVVSVEAVGTMEDVYARIREGVERRGITRVTVPEEN